MEQLLVFIQHHWFLSAAFIIILVLLAGLELYQKIAGIPNLSPQLATQMINHNGAIILDIRTQEQFDKGHIIHAMHIPQAKLNAQLAKLKPHQDQAIIVTCQSGQAALAAAQLLRKQHFAQVFTLKQGINGWRNAQLPLVK